MSQTDFDGAVRVADAISPLDVGSLGLDGLIAQTKMRTDTVRIRTQSVDQRPTGSKIHSQRLVSRPAAGSSSAGRYCGGILSKEFVWMKATPDAQTLAIFPLQNVVLFPSTELPLYIFEPRYRAMTHAALQGTRRIGMVAIRPEALGETAGNPPVFAVGCEGEILRARERSDGTLDILLGATRRFKITAESPASEARPFRTARIEPLEEERLLRDSPEIAQLRKKVVRTLGEILRQIGPKENLELNREESAALKQLEALTDEKFAHVTAQLIDLGVREKQRLLEAPGAGARYPMLDEFLRFRLGELKARIAPGSNTLH